MDNEMKRVRLRLGVTLMLTAHEFEAVSQEVRKEKASSLINSSETSVF